ncbi:hypothetical protein Ancab_001556 [Ancistrocladus abbreviatus]
MGSTAVRKCLVTEDSRNVLADLLYLVDSIDGEGEINICTCLLQETAKYVGDNPLGSCRLFCFGYRKGWLLFGGAASLQFSAGKSMSAVLAPHGA